MTESVAAPNRYWSQLPNSLLSTLRSKGDGLTSAEARQRLEQFGPNVLEAKAKITPLGLFLNQFKSPIILILLFATGLSAVLKDWIDALIILAIVLGSALLSFIQEYNANTAAEKLRDQVTVKASVLRDGEAQAIPAEEVVPGDVVLLSAGSLVPADGVVLEARDFFVNQAVLTGETFPVEKNPDPVAPQAGLTERTNCVFMGTNVRSGSARALIVQAGAGLAALLHRVGGGPNAAIAARHYQHQPVQGLPGHGCWGCHRTPSGLYRKFRQHGRALYRQDRHPDRGYRPARWRVGCQWTGVGRRLSLRLPQCTFPDRAGQSVR
jgi:hypothetical protein